MRALCPLGLPQCPQWEKYKLEKIFNGHTYSLATLAIKTAFKKGRSRHAVLSETKVKAPWLSPGSRLTRDIDRHFSTLEWARSSDPLWLMRDHWMRGSDLAPGCRNIVAMSQTSDIGGEGREGGGGGDNTLKYWRAPQTSNTLTW